MLSTAKPTLEKQINNILKDALYKAQMKQFRGGGDANLSQIMYNHMQKMAMEFATTAADEASGKLANAIYDFVKAIGITAVVKGTLSNTGGPVTGTIYPKDFQIN